MKNQSCCLQRLEMLMSTGDYWYQRGPVPVRRSGSCSVMAVCSHSSSSIWTRFSEFGLNKVRNLLSLAMCCHSSGCVLSWLSWPEQSNIMLLAHARKLVFQQYRRCYRLPIDKISHLKMWAFSIFFFSPSHSNISMSVVKNPVKVLWKLHCRRQIYNRTQPAWSWT